MVNYGPQHQQRDEKNVHHREGGISTSCTRHITPSWRVIWQHVLETSKLDL